MGNPFNGLFYAEKAAKWDGHVHRQSSAHPNCRVMIQIFFCLCKNVTLYGIWKSWSYDIIKFVSIWWTQRIWKYWDFVLICLLFNEYVTPTFLVFFMTLLMQIAGGTLSLVRNTAILKCGFLIVGLYQLHILLMQLLTLLRKGQLEQFLCCGGFFSFWPLMSTAKHRNSFVLVSLNNGANFCLSVARGLLVFRLYCPTYEEKLSRCSRRTWNAHCHIKAPCTNRTVCVYGI